MIELCKHFDAVVMLTWSDWATEPRSNRYHYATRFARHLPVLFVQNQRSADGGIRVTGSGIPNLDVVDVSAPLLPDQTGDLKTLIRYRGFKRPLIWIYDSVNYWPLLDRLPNHFRVYHATEDYFRMESETGNGHLFLRDQLQRLLMETDLVVAATERVLQNICVDGGYRGASIVAENGCDFQFFERLKIGREKAADAEKPAVIYQGGVNSRLDYDLIVSLVRKLPEFEFRFFGQIVESEGVQHLRSFRNLRLYGSVSPETFGEEMLKAMVGIVPFLQNELMWNSLPLKVFEYVACGLPVVSIPIQALEKYGHEDDIIRFATTADEFAASIRALAKVRNEPERVARGERLARLSSYDARFEGVVAAIVANADARRRSAEPLNVALLYDPASSHVGTVREHLEAFRRHSRHTYTFVPAVAVGRVLRANAERNPIDLSLFDAVVVHYSIRISLQSHLAEDFAIALDQFNGLKVLFIQDEYDSVECTRQWMDRIQFDLVYTCVPLDESDKVYPSSRYPATDFLPTLTGYVPESANIDRFVRPLGERRLAFVYRGRELHPIYGRLGHEKLMIGVEARRRAEAMGVPVDIAWDAECRIYGDDWYRFLASGRATLGTESGSNVFDFDGSLVAEIERLKRKRPEMSFEEIWERLLKPHEGHVRMNQISPKIFEAIRLRTALVLFEGEYSGVVRPDIHFIPLKKDFSNFEDVVAKVMDDNLIGQMTERAFSDVIASGTYSYRSFVDGVDRDIQERCPRRRKRRLMYGTVYVMDDDGLGRQCLPVIPLALPCSADVLDNREPLKRLHELFDPVSGQVAASSARGFTSGYAGTAEKQGAVIRRLIVRAGIPAARALHKAVQRHPKMSEATRWLYRQLPERIRLKVRKRVFPG